MKNLKYSVTFIETIEKVFEALHFFYFQWWNHQQFNWREICYTKMGGENLCSNNMPSVYFWVDGS